MSWWVGIAAGAWAGEPANCRVVVYRHEATDADTSFVFRLDLTPPDPAGRSKVVAATLGGPWPELPPSAQTPAPTHRVDTSAEPTVVDWSRWPLGLSFVGPAVADPKQQARYTLTTRPQATREDWGSCILTLGDLGCTIVRDEVGDCVRQYELRHQLGGG